MLALPAGVLADILDRRRLLLAVRWAIFGGRDADRVDRADRMPPSLLFTFTFVLGVGASLTAPT